MPIQKAVQDFLKKTDKKVIRLVKIPGHERNRAISSSAATTPDNLDDTMLNIEDNKTIEGIITNIRNHMTLIEDLIRIKCGHPEDVASFAKKIALDAQLLGKIIQPESTTKYASV